MIGVGNKISGTQCLCAKMPIYGDKQADPVFGVEAGWVTGTDHDSRPVSLDVLHKRSSWGWTRIIMPSPLKQG